jgi:hypothetical protein
VQAALENEILTAYNATPSLQTYFVVLDDDAHDVTAPTGALAFYQQIQSDLPQAVTTLDGTPLDITTSVAPTQMQQEAANTAAANFSNLVAQLGTCVYDYTPPASSSADGGSIDPTTLEVSYTLPATTGAPTRLVVSYAPACTAAAQGSVNGWNFDGGRIRICGNPCSTLRQGILGAAAVAAQNKLPAPDVPVTAAILCGGASALDASAGGSLGSSSGTSIGGDGTGGNTTTDGSISTPVGGGDSGTGGVFRGFDGGVPGGPSEGGTAPGIDASGVIFVSDADIVTP